MRQVEVSRTIVFDAPRRACGFFEALIADNLDIGFRVGDPRVMALAGVLSQMLLPATCITNKSLRALMTGLLHAPTRPARLPTT